MMMVPVMAQGTQRMEGKNAQQDNINAAKAIAGAVRTTLGPKGMDKLLTDDLGDSIVTNDGASILKNVKVDHPAARMIVEVAKTQDAECGDGTTTAVVLAGELLEMAQLLTKKRMHPTTITAGYRMASREAVRVLEEKMGILVPAEEMEQRMRDVALTAMTGKSAEDVKDVLADLAVRAVMTIAQEKVVDSVGQMKVDREDVQIIRKTGGSMSDTKLIEGFVIEKPRAHQDMPERVDGEGEGDDDEPAGVNILLLDLPLEPRRPDASTDVRLNSQRELQTLMDSDMEYIKKLIQQIAELGVGAVFTPKAMSDIAAHLLQKNGIYGVQKLARSDMESLAKATGAKVITDVEALDEADLGWAECVESRRVGEDDMTFVTGCEKSRAVSAIIRGGSSHVVDELARAFTDAVGVASGVMEDRKVAPGGGASAIQISMDLREYATTITDRKRMAVEAFAEALEVIPAALAENAGLDPLDVVLDMRKAHGEGNINHGVNVETGDIVDMVEMRVLEPVRVGRQAIESATDVANMVLRIDDVILAQLAPDPSGPQDRNPKQKGGIGGMGM